MFETFFECLETRIAVGIAANNAIYSVWKKKKSGRYRFAVVACRLLLWPTRSVFQNVSHLSSEKFDKCQIEIVSNRSKTVSIIVSAAYLPRNRTRRARLRSGAPRAWRIPCFSAPRTMVRRLDSGKKKKKSIKKKFGKKNDRFRHGVNDIVTIRGHGVSTALMKTVRR